MYFAFIQLSATWLDIKIYGRTAIYYFYWLTWEPPRKVMFLAKILKKARDLQDMSFAEGSCSQYENKINFELTDKWTIIKKEMMDFLLYRMLLAFHSHNFRNALLKFLLK